MSVSDPCIFNMNMHIRILNRFLAAGFSFHGLLFFYLFNDKERRRIYTYVSIYVVTIGVGLWAVSELDLAATINTRY